MFNTNLFNPEKTPIVLLGEGCFGAESTKIITGVIRYGKWPVVAGIDSTKAGETIESVLGYGGLVPIVSSIKDTLKYNPKALMIGIATQGGRLPDEWRQIILEALDNNLDIINGLHTFLSNDTEISNKAKEKGKILWDVRLPVIERLVCKNLPRCNKTKVVLTVGSDCSCGKMFTALELNKFVNKSKFIATGQTGILISGNGIPIDSIQGDFMSGEIENIIINNIDDKTDWLFIEGQGSLIHPSFSGITLALMHGSSPDAMILCHNPSRNNIKHFDIKIPSINRMIEIYETAMGFVKPVKIAGISLNCQSFDKNETKKIIKETEELTGLPTVDPVKDGVEKLYNNLLEVFAKDDKIRIQTVRT